MNKPHTPTHRLFVSSLVEGRGPALHVTRFTSATGTLAQLMPVSSPLGNIFILACSPDKTRLFAAEFIKDSPGAVHMFALSTDDSDVSHLGSQPTLDSAPCFLSIPPDGDQLLIAGYAKGSVTTHAIAPDGTLSPHATRFLPTPPSPAIRPRAHCVLPSPCGRFFLTTFLGLDHVTCHTLTDPRTPSTLISTAQLPPKSGPRHLTWHPSGVWVLGITETSSQAFSLALQPDTGHLTLKDIQLAVAPEFAVTSRAADIAIHPAGDLIYTSNRGHDSITAFRFDPQTGALTLINQFPCLGQSPQNLKFSPCGGFLLCANLKSHQIITFKVDPTTGHLTPMGSPLLIQSPSSILFC